MNLPNITIEFVDKDFSREELRWFAVTKIGFVCIIASFLYVVITETSLTGIYGTVAFLISVFGGGIWGYGYGRLAEIDKRKDLPQPE